MLLDVLKCSNRLVISEITSMIIYFAAVATAKYNLAHKGFRSARKFGIGSYVIYKRR